MFNILNLSKKHKKYIFIAITLTLIITSIFVIIKKQKINIVINKLHHTLLNEDNTYTHQGNDIIINIYNTTKKEKNFRFKLITQNIKYLSNQKIIQLIHPNITIFDAKNNAIWKITSNQATVCQKQKILSLHGHIHINNLSKNANLSSIITNQAIINLITNDIFSNTKVILHGNYFYSIGTQMHGNLYTKTIKLINNTYTYYEIQQIKYSTKNIDFN